MRLDADSRRSTPTSARTDLQVEGVTRVFPRNGNALTALQDVSFQVEAGKFVSLVGPSGCGKSTMLKIISGLLPPTAGCVLFGGERIAGTRIDIGLMFQTPTLFPWRSVVRNITLPLEIRRSPVSFRSERAQEVIDLVGLRGFEGSFPRELSGGMQQRVALCRLLISDPALMLLDEPFGSLDEFTREYLNVELARICEHEHKTTVFVTHNIPEAVFLSDQVVVMGKFPGRVVDVVDIQLPRPRVRELVNSSEQSRHVEAVRRTLGLA